MPPTTTVATVTDAFEALKRELGPNSLALGPICTRVMLRTGVNIKEPRPDQVRDAALVTKVLGALADMGHRL